MGGQTTSFQAPELNVNQTFTFAGSDLNPFTGPGFIDFFFGSDSIDTIIGPTSVSTAVQSIFTGSIKATYSYTAAPLPSALIFLLSGLAGITGYRKFRGRASV